MVRLFPPPYEGLDKAFPKNPDALYANDVIGVAPLIGTLYGAGALCVAKLLRRPTPGVFLNNTARFTLYSSVFGFSYQELKCRYRVKPYLEGKKISIPPRVMIQNNGVKGQDDYFLMGAAVGLLLASMRRFSIGSAGWKRYFGSASVFSTLASFPVWWVLNYEKASLAMQEQLNREREALDSVIQQTMTTMISRSKDAPTILESIRGSDQGKEGSSDHQISFAVPHSSSQPDVMPAGAEPHTAVKVDGRRKFVPNTDYMWVADDSGIEKLREHIDELREIRNELAVEAEWLWGVLASKEESFYTETDPKSKDLKRRELELLGGLHSRYWTEIAGYDWMIADSKKLIQQTKHNYRWRPQPGGDEIAMHGPEMSVRAIKRHLSDKLMVTQHLASAILPDEAPPELKEELLHHIEAEKRNVEATSSVLREFEEKIAEARKKRQQYESQKKEKKEKREKEN